MQHLIDQIKARREELGLSKYRMAKDIGVSQSMLSRLESGERINASYEMLAKIGFYLGLKLFYKKVKKSS